MPYISEENHFTLQNIREKHGLSMELIANHANVAISKVWLLENHGYVSERDVDSILASILCITNECYTRCTIGGYWTGEASEAFKVEFRYG